MTEIPTFLATRPEVLEQLRALEAKVDRLADRVIFLEGEGRRKRARAAYARAVRLQAEANDLRELLEKGRIVREAS